ncbi:MAG: competence protein ComFB [Spirochaetaceae bacterium]|nr:MAG: competence protein ComFB [Spirochaetaceae bacterium]
MSLIDDFRLEDLVNESERLVLEELEAQLQGLSNSSLCSSTECVLDMAAYALNAVRPMYRVNLMGRIYADAVSDEKRAEVKEAVSRAIEKVRRNPPQE